MCHLAFVPDTPSHIVGDIFALLLVHHGEDSAEKLSGQLRGVDALLLEAVPLPPGPSTPGWPSRHSLAFRANREEDFTTYLSTRPRRQPARSRWKSSRFSAEVPVIPLSAYTSTNSHSGLAVMKLRVVGVLGGKGVELILRAGAHPGIGCHTEFPIPDRIAGRDGNHLGRTVQRQGTAGFLLLVHEIASLYSLSYSQ